MQSQKDQPQNKSFKFRVRLPRNVLENKPKSSNPGSESNNSMTSTPTPTPITVAELNPPKMESTTDILPQFPVGGPMTPDKLTPDKLSVSPTKSQITGTSPRAVSPTVPDEFPSINSPPETLTQENPEKALVDREEYNIVSEERPNRPTSGTSVPSWKLPPQRPKTKAPPLNNIETLKTTLQEALPSLINAVGLPEPVNGFGDTNLKESQASDIEKDMTISPNVHTPPEHVVVEDVQLLVKENAFFRRQFLERFILDNAVIFSFPEYDAKTPISLKVLYLSIKFWKSFKPPNQNFIGNMLNVIEHTLLKNIYDLELSCYWINVLARMLNLLKQEFPFVDSCFSSIPVDTKQDCFDKIVDLLLDHHDLIFKIADQLVSKDIQLQEEFSEAIVRVTLEKGLSDVLSLLKYSVLTEVESTQQFQQLFRSNSFSTKLMKHLCFFTAKPLLKKLLTGIIDLTQRKPANFEVDPDKLPKGEDINVNAQNIMTIVEDFLLYLINNLQLFTLELRIYCRFLYEFTEKRFQVFNKLDPLEPKYIAVNGFLFLRLISPALVDPVKYDLCYGEPPKLSKRFLILITKVLQNIANGKELESKELYMSVFSKFIRKWIPLVADFVDKIVTRDPTEDYSSRFMYGYEYEISMGQLFDARSRIFSSIAKTFDSLNFKEDTKLRDQLLSLTQKIALAGAQTVLLPPILNLETPDNIIPGTSDIECISNFASKIHLFVSRTYMQMIENLSERLEQPLLRHMFNEDSAGNRGISRFESMVGRTNKVNTEVVSILNEYMDIFKKSYMDSQLINHFFESLAVLIDDFIANRLLRKPLNEQKVLEIKMGLSYIESWFNINSIKSYRTKDEVCRYRIFASTNQCINILMISSEEVFKNFGITKELAPMLSKEQVMLLLRESPAYTGEEYPKVNGNRDSLARMLRHSVVDLRIFTDFETHKLVRRPLFNLSWELQRLTHFNKVQIPERYLIHADLGFLDSKFYLKVREKKQGK